MGRLNRSACAIVAAITLACGGKTEILEEGDITGSDGAGGRSGAGAGGSAGAIGASGRGGSTGASGSAGRGGSVGVAGAAGRGGSGAISGVGGSGGVTPGGSGGTGGSTAQIIDAICTHYEQHGCGYENCRHDLRRSVETYDLWGCGQEWLETNACSLRDPTPCGGSEFCNEAQAIYQTCIDDAEICVRGNTPGGGCVMGCEQGWAVECKPDTSGLICVCTSGRNSGRQFMAAACQSEEWLKTIRSSCQ